MIAPELQDKIVNEVLKPLNYRCVRPQMWAKPVGLSLLVFSFEDMVLANWFVDKTESSAVFERTRLEHTTSVDDFHKSVVTFEAYTRYNLPAGEMRDLRLGIIW